MYMTAVSKFSTNSGFTKQVIDPVQFFKIWKFLDAINENLIICVISFAKFTLTKEIR